LIVSTDKTQVTLFRDKMAYPIYLTIGNIPKRIRREVNSQAQILIGYIPTTKLTGISGATARRWAMTNLFHACMQSALGPISSYGETGIEMKCGNGIWRRCHPILAAFVADHSVKLSRKTGSPDMYIGPKIGPTRPSADKMYNWVWPTN